MRKTELVYYATFHDCEGHICRTDTRIYFDVAKVPSSSDICRAVVYCKNPGGTAMPIMPLLRALGKGPVKLYESPILRQIGKLMQISAEKAGTVFGLNDYVHVANVISHVTGSVKLAVKLELLQKSTPDDLHSPVGGIWFAWVGEKALDPFRKKALDNLCETNHGETCFVQRINKNHQTPCLGCPKPGTKVQHPQGIKEKDALLKVLPGILVKSDAILPPKTPVPLLHPLIFS